MKRSLLLLVLFYFFSACTHKAYVAPVVVAPVGCDTTVVTYHADIKPMLAANCYSCHATAVTQGGGLDLEDFTSLKAYLQNGFRGDGVYGSKLYHCMLHSSLALPMPPTYVVDSCSLNKMKRWMDQGGNNN